MTNTLSATVSIIDVTKGSLLRMIPVDKNLVALAVDERTDRIIVVTKGPSDGAGVAPGQRDDHRAGCRERAHPVHRPLDGDPSAVAVDARYGRVVVTNMGAIDSMSNYDGAGRMTELDERTGTTLRSVAVGVAGSISPLTNVPVVWS